MSQAYRTAMIAPQEAVKDGAAIVVKMEGTAFQTDFGNPAPGSGTGGGAAVDLMPLLPRDGTRPMTGPLNMGSKEIRDVAEITGKTATPGQAAPVDNLRISGGSF